MQALARACRRPECSSAPLTSQNARAVTVAEEYMERDVRRATPGRDAGRRRRVREMDWLENAAMRLERPWFLVCSLIKLYATGDVAPYDLAEDPGQSAPCSGRSAERRRGRKTRGW